MIKQYSIVFLLWTYSAVGMVEPKHVQMLLPENIIEHILDYFPADSYARAYWSRYIVCSQEFYDASIQAFLKSHFVPDFCIDKIINQYFATFCSKKATKKQEFKERIKRAFVRYTEPDTQEHRLFKSKLEELHHLTYFLEPFTQLIIYDNQQLREYFVKLKSDELKEVMQLMQKKYSQTQIYSDTLKELIVHYGQTNVRIYSKLLEFFEPFEYVFAKMVKSMHSRKIQACIGCCVLLYGIVCIVGLKAYWASQEELDNSIVLRAFNSSSASLFLSVPLLMSCIGAVITFSIITDIVINRAIAQSDFIKHTRFLMQVLRKLKLAIYQAKRLAQA